MNKAQYDEYEKIELIGGGAFGRCYLCKKRDETFVVLKKIAYGEDAINEARILSKLDHKNVIKAYDTYRSANSIYIVLEYLPGGNLDGFIRRHQEPLKNEKIFDFLLQICEGLVYIHSKNVIHRDVKPVNCLLTKDYSTLKLADFGLSVLLRNGEKIQGRLGTSAYMSPEVLDGREYDYKCDMWALGCILFELSERRRLFDASSDMAVQYKVCMGKFTLPENNKFTPLMQLLLTNSTTNRPTALEFLLVITNFNINSLR